MNTEQNYSGTRNNQIPSVRILKAARNDTSGTIFRKKKQSFNILN